MANDRMFSPTNRIEAAVKALKYHLFRMLHSHESDEHIRTEKHAEHV